MNRNVGVLVALVAALVMALGAAAPAAAAHTHYGESARAVAKEINCKRFHRTGSGVFNKDAGVCWVKGKRVNVITFANKRKQRQWNSAAKWGLPSNHYWANGKGAVVTAKNGNKKAAKIGAKRLPGKVIHAW